MNKLTQKGNQEHFFYLIVVVVCFLLFAFVLLSDFTCDLLHKARYGPVFFDMYKRLSVGDVTINPALLVNERYIVHGKVIPYFLPFPALIRGFLSIFKVGSYPLPSILMAITLYCVSVHLLLRNVLKLLECKEASAVLVAWYPFFLLPMVSLWVEASIYYEAIMWAFAMFMTQAVLFIAYLSDPQIVKKYLLMLVSGAVLFTRPTYGAACVVLVAIVFFYDIKSKNYSFKSLLPYVFFIVALFLLAWLNEQRWGNPLEFCNLKCYELSLGTHRGKMAAIEPNLSLIRIPETLKYYFFIFKSNFCLHPPFIKIGGEGVPSYGLFDYVEPCYSIILLLPFHLLAGLGGLWGFLSGRLKFNLNERNIIGSFLLISLIPIVMILMLVYMALRYRSEFFPFIIFSSMIGIIFLQQSFSKERIFKLAFRTTIFASILVIYGAFVERCFWTYAGLPIKNPQTVTVWFGRHALDPNVYTHYVFSVKD